MPPHGKPTQSVGRDFQRQHSRKDQRRNGQRHGTHTAGTKIRDHKKGAEENQRRAEVVHQGKQAADENGIGDKNVNIPLAHDSVHGGRAGIDEADLAQLRRLQGQAADDQPVFRAVILGAEHQRHHQKAHARHRGQIPDDLRPFQIPQRPADDEKRHHAQRHGGKLLHRLPRLYRGDGGHTHGTQEERHGLHLKGLPADHAVENVQQPLAQENAAEAHENAGDRLLLPAQQEAQQHQALQDGQHHQIRHAVPAAGCLGAKLCLTRFLMLRNGLELHFHTADGDTVFWLQRANLNLSAVDQRSVF